MLSSVVLRDVAPDDLPIFYQQQLDPEATHMAAFTAKDPADQDAFTAHWNRILANPTGIIKTIIVSDQVVGNILSYQEAGRVEVSYWLGKEYWGKGFASQALIDFLTTVQTTRPIYARAAKDNRGSLRVLEKCGFTIIGEDKGFAHARGTETEEFVLKRE
jgi:RimJ/RimL family protein N-acetyltransferase